MALSTRILASGEGWRVADVICAPTPHERPFEEQHPAVCISAVTDGLFQYRGTQGAAVLAPGALMLGNQHHCFACGHEHSRGDRCVSFHFTPPFMESVVACLPGARQLQFSLPSLPPLPELLPIVAAAEAARDDGDAAELAELALRLAGAVATVLAGANKRSRAPSTREERRIAAVLHQIERHAQASLSLAALARTAAMSPYHFLRTFRAVVGMTPHQFILHTRMRRAAVRLRRSHDSISAIAYEAGFNDLSTFNRRFQRLVGTNPSRYRAAARG